MSSAPAPTREGFFWGIHRMDEDDETAETGALINREWEVHHVVKNSVDGSGPEGLMVMVPGIQKWQPLDAFVWGEECHRTGHAEARAYARAADELGHIVRTDLYAQCGSKLREAWHAFDRARIAWRGRPS